MSCTRMGIPLRYISTGDKYVKSFLLCLSH